MPKEVDIDDEVYEDVTRIAQIAEYDDTEAFIVEVLTRRTRSILETFGLYK
ncbi:MAG: hypothetical protein L0213_05260 [Candidatus Dadabacteria bacterium]|nr:hypothetical protein [Candidatus Dadabacteria bacterium]